MVSRAAPLDLGRPIARLTYNGVPLWDAISSDVIDLTFTDNIEGEADEIQLKVHNASGKWFSAWTPEHGDEIEGAFGYVGSIMVPLGTFFVDKPSAAGGRGGDTFSTSGQSAPVSKALRTQKTRAFENQTLADAVRKVAGEHGLEVVGTPPALHFERITQRRETDLAFLKRLAEDYGCFFKVAGKKLVFMARSEVWGRNAIRTIVKGSREIVSYTLNYEAAKTASKAKASYYLGNEKKKIEVEVEDSEVKTGDTLRIDDRAENEGQARELAKSRLQKANLKQWTGNFTLVGDPLLLAGQNVLLSGYGRWDRKYSITRARHQLSRSGLTTAIEQAGTREGEGSGPTESGKAAIASRPSTGSAAP
ncbi:MAG: late control protein D [Chelatococcus sp.]|nr:MAG: late control protein D [Chelatococcus sp.]